MSAVFVRDQTVTVTVNFFDPDGAAANPLSATLTLEYPTSDGCRTSASYALTQDGNDWTYDWDSRPACSGDVYGHAETDGTTPISAVDFEFALTANSANRAA